MSSDPNVVKFAYHDPISHRIALLEVDRKLLEQKALHAGEVKMVRYLQTTACTLSILLVINIIMKLLKRPFLVWLYHRLLTCPGGSEGCVLWWQHFSTLEKLIWSIIDTIEVNYGI